MSDQADFKFLNSKEQEKFAEFDNDPFYIFDQRLEQIPQDVRQRYFAYRKACKILFCAMTNDSFSVSSASAKDLPRRLKEKEQMIKQLAAKEECPK